MRILLLLTGWALFGVSLLPPALRVSGTFGGTFRGWHCLVLSVPCIGAFLSGEPKGFYVSLVGLSNVLMLASPALVAWGGRWATAQKLAFLAAAIVVCSWRVVANDHGTEFLVGYHVWCASFVVFAAALHFNK